VNKNLKLVLFGFMVWLIPFLVCFVVFPLKETMRPLFESIMPLVLTITVITLAYYYLKDMDADFAKAGVIAGVVWFAISIIVDLALFLPASPMQMGFTDYMMDIGLTYVMIPVITTGMGYMAQNL
jgi:hypothetical protein